MSDPLGIITSIRGADQSWLTPPQQVRVPADGPGFIDLLRTEVQKVNDLQRDATRAMEDLAVGRRDDVQAVITATLKADTAFKMLVSVRNKLMEAYEEIKQVRV